MAALPRPVAYDPARVAFNQDQCVVCLEPFENNQRVTELACKHIFHNDCIPRQMEACPTCRSPILQRIHHQVQVENGQAFLQQLFSQDPVVLNQRLDEIARTRSIWNDDFGTRLMADLRNEDRRRRVLGDQRYLDVERQANVLFFRDRMGQLQQMNRFRRLVRISLMPEGTRFLDLCDHPETRTPLSQRVAREFEADRKKALDVIGLAFCATLYWEKYLRPSYLLCYEHFR